LPTDLTFLVLAEFVMETQISEIDSYVACLQDGQSST
jgi:hypothetical protein